MTSTTPALDPPPYLGPTSFSRGETLYGRDREAQELCGLLISERIVLLYSPSGAGKTSLVQARVIPELERREFTVLPVLRVSRSLPGDAGNRYLSSVARSLHGEVAPGESLDAMLARHAPGDPAPDVVLIFDQFEEILTLDPTDIAAKRTFFSELGRALLNRGRWALFVMREDYIAGLDPYLRLVPTRLSSTFRLDLLGERAAAEAISGPAEARGVRFEPAAVRRLVDDLRRTQVQGADGKVEEQPGPYVEPVQLQVVCLRLWREWAARRAPDDFTMSEADLLPAGGGAAGSVDDALRAYYDEAVARVAAGDGDGPVLPPKEREARERAVRDFFDLQLITADGVRGQVLQGYQATHGLANAAIRQLVDAYLVRSERRGGRTWYELAHDRLIRPVRASNDRWKREHLVPAQTQALVWERQGRPPGLLLRGEELQTAEVWAAAGDVVVTDLEREFLAACSEQACAEARERRRNRLIRLLAVVASVVALLAAGLAAFALVARNESAARALAAQSTQALSESNPRALLLAREAAAATAPLGPVGDAEAALYRALAAGGGVPLAAGQEPLLAVAASPDGAWIAAGGADTHVRLWAAADLSAPPQLLRGHRDDVGAVAFSPDGMLLASVGDDGTLHLWQPGSPAARPQVLAGAGAALRTVAFSPDGAWLAAGDLLGRVVMWPLVGQGGARVVLEGHSELIRALAFSPDSGLLASAADDATARVWELAGAPAPRHVLEGHEGPVNAVAFSPDGATIATGSSDSTTRLWAADSGALLDTLVGQSAPVVQLRPSPDGSLLAAGDFAGQILLWDRADTGPQPVVLAGLGQLVAGMAFSDDGATLFSAASDGALVVWTVALAGDGQIILGGHEGPIRALAAAPAFLATASEDATVRVWPRVGLGPLPLLGAAPADVISLDLSRDGQLTAVTARGGALRWQLGGQAGAAPAPPPWLPPLAGQSLTAFAPDRRWLATVDDEQQLRRWDLSRPEAAPAALGQLTARGVSLAISPDGRLVAAAAEDGALTLFTADGTAQPRSLASSAGALTSLAFDPAGERLAGGADDGALSLWDLRQPEVAPLVGLGHTSGVIALAFSPDGLALASGDLDGLTRLWQTGASLEQGAALRVPGMAVQALAFSPDGRTLATGGIDAIIRLWAVGRPAAAPQLIDGQGASLTALAFSPDGAALASGDVFGRVRLWPLGAERLSAMACQQAGRNLTLAEWQRAFGATPYRKSCPDLPVSPSLIDTAAELALVGELDEARALERRVRELGAAGEIPARAWGRYCRALGLSGEVAAARAACDDAVTADPADGLLLDWRALSRAGTGDLAGAADDLRVSLAWARATGRAEDQIALRETWLAALEAGANPYDAAALQALRLEGDRY